MAVAASALAGVDSDPAATPGGRFGSSLAAPSPDLLGSSPDVAAAQQLGVEPWPLDWFSDLPADDLTGKWDFDPANSDPMLTDWADLEVYYEINQQGGFIVLDFRVTGAQSNNQTHRWDGTISRFERAGRQVEEAARWTDAGRVLEIAGRHWDPGSPEERTYYRFTYEVDGDVLTFVQESDGVRTVWRFNRDRGVVASPGH